MANRLPWRLVAPWYRWERQRVETPSRAPRETRPVLQKYQTPDPVNVFLKDPQLSLKFGPDDYAYDLHDLPKPRWNSRITRWSDQVLVRTNIRKLYLGAHRRAYLVVCELHCDAAGLPRVTPDQVCKAGFVIRRRGLRVPADALSTVVPILRRIGALSTQVALLSRRAPARRQRRSLLRRVLSPVSAALGLGQLDAATQLITAREALLRWKTDAGATWIAERWVPSEFHGIGVWEPVEDRPPELGETTYPLYPLLPDPRDPDHAGAGCTIYFGLVPTGGAETDERGHPRFDDEALYDIRCFVRRHRPECPKTGEANDCGGDLVWSEATEPYRLAAPTDLTGAANAPLTVKMPDLPRLAAEVAQRPFGDASPVRLVSPEGSGFQFKVQGNLPAAPQPPAADVLRLATPLHTAVAAFLLQMFMPVVVPLFQLYYLLPLEFSVPSLPKIESALATLLAQLEAGGSLENNAGARSLVTQRLSERFGGDIGSKLAQRYGTDLLAKLEGNFQAPPAPPTLTATLEFEDPVERPVRAEAATA